MPAMRIQSVGDAARESEADTPETPASTTFSDRFRQSPG
jgi:hypothetical protein